MTAPRKPFPLYMRLTYPLIALGWLWAIYYAASIWPQ